MKEKDTRKMNKQSRKIARESAIQVSSYQKVRGWNCNESPIFFPKRKKK